MQGITIMGYFLEAFERTDIIACPVCDHPGINGWGVRTNFELIHPQVGRRYEYTVLADEYHVCSQCNHPYVIRVDVLANRLYKP